MRQKQKKEQFILKCKGGKLLSKPLDEIKTNADPSATENEGTAAADDDNMIGKANDVYDSDEGGYAVDATGADTAESASAFAECDGEVLPKALEYIKTTAEARGNDDASGGTADGAASMTPPLITTWLVPPPALPPEREAVGTRERGGHIAEAQQYQGNKECTATGSVSPAKARPVGGAPAATGRVHHREACCQQKPRAAAF
jgi:hypothetical protein